MEVDQSVGVLAEVVTPTEVIYPDPAPMQESELTWVLVEAEDEAAVSSAAQQDKFPGEEGKHLEQVAEAEQQLVLANHGLNMGKGRLFTLETKISPLLMETQSFLKRCGGRLLPFSRGTELSVVKAPVQKDAILIEEPIDNSNSQTEPSSEIAALIPLTTSMSLASNETKEKSPGDGAVGGTGQPSENESKTSKDGSAAASESITESPKPSRRSLSPAEITSTPSANQIFITKDQIKAALLQQANVTTHGLVRKLRSRQKTREDKLAFSGFVRGICKVHSISAPALGTLRHIAGFFD